VKLPGGKILITGVVGRATDLVEHPELVARHDQYLKQLGDARAVGNGA
jgi:hypothetical protein